MNKILGYTYTQYLVYNIIIHLGRICIFLLCSHYTVHFVDETIFKSYNNTAPTIAPSLKKIVRKEKKKEEKKTT